MARATPHLSAVLIGLNQGQATAVAALLPTAQAGTGDKGANFLHLESSSFESQTSTVLFAHSEELLDREIARLPTYHTHKYNTTRLTELAKVAFAHQTRSKGRRCRVRTEPRLKLRG